MKRRYGILLALPLLLSLAPPAHAQLDGNSPWPRRFHDNENRSRASFAGPDGALSLKHTYTVANCSAPVIGGDVNKMVYVTSSGTFMSNACALYAFTISSNQLVLSWTAVLTGVGGRFLSAPTLSSGYAYIGAGDVSGGAGANLIKVDLGGMHAATSVQITSLPQTAANVPPFIDSSGNVYVCTESIASGGGAKIASYTSGLGLNWKTTLLDNFSMNADGNPFAGMRLVFKSGSPSYLYGHVYYLKYTMMGTYRQKLLTINASNGAL